MRLLNDADDAVRREEQKELDELLRPTRRHLAPARAETFLTRWYYWATNSLLRSPRPVPAAIAPPTT